jgi:hypothetical protein
MTMSQIATIEPMHLPADPMIAMIERVVMDPNASLDKLERMLAMKERLDAANAEQAFNQAFAAAASEFPTIPLNGKGHNNKPYALLKDIVSITRPILSRHGLTLNWEVEITDKVRVTARLRHLLGHSTGTSILLPSDTSGSKNPVQALGSSQSYGERYTAQAILGLSLGEDVDDDGKAAGAGSTISADQFRELRGLMAEAGIGDADLCRFYGVEHVEELPAQNFIPAMNLIRQRQAKAKANA